VAHLPDEDRGAALHGQHVLAEGRAVDRWEEGFDTWTPRRSSEPAGDDTGVDLDRESLLRLARERLGPVSAEAEDAIAALDKLVSHDAEAGFRALDPEPHRAGGFDRESRRRGRAETQGDRGQEADGGRAGVHGILLIRRSFVGPADAGVTDGDHVIGRAHGSITRFSRGHL